MSHHPAHRSAPSFSLSGLFGMVRRALDGVRADDFFEMGQLDALYAAMETRFARDYERAASYRDLLFGVNCDHYGEGAADIFKSWDVAGDSPYMTTLAVLAIEEFGLDVDDILTHAIFLSAFLADYPNTLQYHGNEHYRKVLFHTIRLIATHNQIVEGEGDRLTKRDISLLLIAACAHDLGHEGGDNLRDGVYTPGFMEQRAVDLIRPYHDFLGMDADAAGAVETMVFCTDITFFAGDNSPCIRLKKIYRRIFWDDRSEDISLMMMGKLRRFEDNHRLIHMAMLLHEADIATSAGLTYDQTVQETLNLMEERNSRAAGPRTVVAFLREQLGESLYTQSAKRLFARPMAAIIAQAERDMAAGRDSFYTP